MTEGVNQATLVCCFLSRKYQETDRCKIELEYAYKKRKNIIVCKWNGSDQSIVSNWIQKIINDSKNFDFMDLAQTPLERRITYFQVEILSVEFEEVSINSYHDFKCEAIRYHYTKNFKVKRSTNPLRDYTMNEGYIPLTLATVKQQEEKQTALVNQRIKQTIWKSYTIKCIKYQSR